MIPPRWCGRRGTSASATPPAIWFAQVIGREIRIIDYYEASGVDLGHYAPRSMHALRLCRAQRPDDAQAKELGTGKSRLEVMESLGLKHTTLAPLHRVEDGINAVRMVLPRCWFDEKKCARGIDALKLYRADYDHCAAGAAAAARARLDLARRGLVCYLAMTLDRRTAESGFHRRIEYAQQGVA